MLWYSFRQPQNYICWRTVSFICTIFPCIQEEVTHYSALTCTDKHFESLFLGFLWVILTDSASFCFWRNDLFIYCMNSGSMAMLFSLTASITVRILKSLSFLFPGVVYNAAASSTFFEISWKFCPTFLIYTAKNSLFLLIFAFLK